MRLTYLELHNVKSYAGPVRIDLTSGLNAVCGLNGSGKTTVLEAIGFALFNHLPYNQQAFIREGQHSGTVRVGILARDGRQYEVVRKLGSGAQHYVADVETGTRIAQRKETLTWIREKALDIDSDTDLEALFKNAVGVPQGAMTADFHGSANTRKSVFDPLLRVEEYRQAYEYLRETVSYVRERTTQIDQDIAVLRIAADQIPAKEEEIGCLRETTRVNEARLATLIEHLERVMRQRQELDDLDAQLHAFAGEQRGAEYDINRETAFLQDRTSRLRQAEQAQLILTEARPGYETVLDARTKITELERQRIERDSIAGRQAAARAAAQGISGQIQQLDQERDRARQAGEKAARLVGPVARQDELERELQSVKFTLRDAARLDVQIERLRQEIGSLESICHQRESAIRVSRGARLEGERLPEVQAQLDDRSTRLAELGPLKASQQALKKEGVELRARHDRLLEEVKRYKQIECEAADLLPLAAGLEALLARQLDLRERRARAQAAVEYQAVARQDLRRRQCPLLELQCPVVTTDPAVLERFDARNAELVADGQALVSLLAEVNREVRDARVAATSYQRLEVEMGGLKTSGDDCLDVENRLLRCREQYQRVTEITDHENEWRRDLTRLQDELKRLHDAARTAAELRLLEEQDERDRRALELQTRELRHLEKERLTITSQENRAIALETEVAALHDPRSQQQGFLAVAARREEIESRLAAEQKRLDDATCQLMALVAAGQRFETLDDMIVDQRGREQHHAADHDRYLQSRSDASQIEERRRAVALTETALAAAQARCGEIARQMAELGTTYDAARHAELKRGCEDAGKDVVREGTVLEHAQTGLQQAIGELAQLQLRSDRLRAHEDERDELVQVGRAIGFIRDTIKAAGPAVTESLLTNISQGANEFYAEIMDDHAAELRWDRDYEILVQRGADARTFAQLSGGEQMSAALAVRLALLKEMSEIDFALFDEPTQNMDEERRGNLAGQIRAVRGFEQLIVISHDDSFEHHTDHLIRLQKVNEETEVG